VDGVIGLVQPPGPVRYASQGPFKQQTLLCRDMMDRSTTYSRTSTVPPRMLFITFYAVVRAQLTMLEVQKIWKEDGWNTNMTSEIKSGQLVDSLLILSNTTEPRGAHNEPEGHHSEQCHGR
jgi:hypothetical protein